MKHYNLLRNTLLGTAAATLAAAPTAASVDELLAAATSSSVSPPLHTSLRALSTTTTMSSANIISPAYDRAMRHLQQESSNQDALDHCSGHTTAMITCLLTQCVGQQPCDDDQDESTSSTEVAEGGVRDCKTVTAEVCGALDHSCCEPCSDHTKAYLDCFLDFEVSGTCPEASCTAGGADNGREISNSTSPSGSLSATKPNATTNVEDATTGAGGKPSGTPQVPDNASAGNATTATTDNANITKGCDTVARDLKTCVDLNCAFRNCNDNPLGSGPGSIKICGSTTEEYCDAFEETQRCCPQCKELTTKSADCFLESIADSCPGAVCSGKNKNGVPPPNKRKAHLLEVSAAAATSWEHEQQEARSYSSSGGTPVAVALPFLVAGVLMTFWGVL